MRLLSGASGLVVPAQMRRASEGPSFNLLSMQSAAKNNGVCELSPHRGFIGQFKYLWQYREYFGTFHLGSGPPSHFGSVLGLALADRQSRGGP